MHILVFLIFGFFFFLQVVKMRANLEKFQFSKINPMKQQLQSTHDSLNVSVVSFIISSIPGLLLRI